MPFRRAKTTVEQKIQSTGSLRRGVTAWKQASRQQAPLLAAGVAFYAFTSLFPALIAGISLYGLFVSAERVEAQIDQLFEVMPHEAASLLGDQMTNLATSADSALGLSAAIALALALYSASGGVGNLVVALNQMFGLVDDRGFVVRKGLALGLTVGGILFLTAVGALTAATPAVLNIINASDEVRLVTEVARWALMALVVVTAIGVLFRVAPNRPAKTRVFSGGVLLAAGIWIVASVGFSVYVNNFGSYGATYGALAGVVVLLLWLWVGIYALLLGAAVQAASERIITPHQVATDNLAAQERTDELRVEADTD